MFTAPRARSGVRTLLVAPLALALAAGCGPASVSEAGGEPELRAGLASLTADNGLSANGLSANGLSANGLSANGLSANGLSANGLSANGLSANGLFTSWFNANAATSPTLMSYVYRCAAPAGQSVVWKNPTTGASYTWAGALGLARGWTSGKAATVTEQQLVSACLAAHVNLYGFHVSISVRGVDGSGAVIPVSTDEAANYVDKEACWFGNLFDGEGVGFAYDTGAAGASLSSTRACAFPSPNGTPSCAPIVNTAQYCWNVCTRDASGQFWRSCTWNGRTYAPLTTMYRQQEIATCGDGVCQPTEKCGTTLAATSCVDCGPCK